MWIVSGSNSYNCSMLKLNNLLLVISFFLLILSFTKRNEFTPSLQLLPELQLEPVQTPTDKAAFSTTYNDELFEIMPKYNYELYGLVVSYRLHDSESGPMLHALNKDHINVADFCVVWGASANLEILADFEFRNAQFTCYWQTKTQNAWDQFNQDKISNNHLISINEDIRATIDEIKIGDQIYIKGWLSHYTNPVGYERRTSITRTDTGNGACETILVSEINILSQMQSVWRQLMWLSLGLLILTLFVYFKAPYEPHK